MAKDMEARTLLLLLLLRLSAVCEYDDEDDADVCYYVCVCGLCVSVREFLWQSEVSALIHRQIFGRD